MSDLYIYIPIKKICRGIAFFLFLSVIFTYPLEAKTIEDYHEEIRKAIEKVDLACEYMEEGKNMEVNIEKLLPFEEVISLSGGSKVIVHNYWLSREAEDFKSSKIDDKLLILKRIKSRLAVLLNLPCTSLNTNREEVKSGIKKILSERQFHYVDLYSLKEKIIKWLMSNSFIKELLNLMEINMDPQNQNLILYIILVITSIFVSAIAGYIIISIKRRFISGLQEDSEKGYMSSRKDALVLEKKAGELSKKGDYRMALQCLLGALLLNFDKKDILPFEPSRTNREYLCMIKIMENYKLLKYFESFCNIYEHKWYGLESCSEEEYGHAFELFKECIRKG